MAGDAGPTTRTVELFHPIERRNASLRLVVFDQSGHVIPYGTQTSPRRITDRVLQRWSYSKEPPVTYTLQVLVPSLQHDATATAQVEELLRAAREHVAGQLGRHATPAS